MHISIRIYIVHHIGIVMYVNKLIYTDRFLLTDTVHHIIQNGESALMYAAINGHLECLTYLADNNANIEAKNYVRKKPYQHMYT
jgi:hypothetical protein